jgi:hypothetical protein
LSLRAGGERVQTMTAITSAFSLAHPSGLSQQPGRLRGRGPSYLP